MPYQKVKVKYLKWLRERMNEYLVRDKTWVTIVLTSAVVWLDEEEESGDGPVELVTSVVWQL